MPRTRRAPVRQASALDAEAPTIQESFLRQVLDINPNLIFAKDRAGRFTLVNKAVADLYGTTVEQLLGKTDADFNADAEQVAFFRRIDLQVMDSQQELFVPEEVLTDANGKRHWLQTVKRPIIGPDGVANQVLGVATDITQRRELEEQLRRAQKMEAIGELAGGIAHDFNNMLAVILGNAERLLAKHRRLSPDDKSLLDGLELIESAGTRGSELISQLMTFSRKQQMAPVVLNLGAVVASLEELVRTLIGERVNLVIQRCDEAIRIRIDRGRLDQLIVNLAVNARDAMPSGGQIAIETTTINTAECSVQPGVPPGRYALLSISDSGVGIPPDIVDRIFEPFFSTKSRGKGSGLGLSIVYGIVQQAGGHISVESSPGHGTTFRVLFPSVDDPLTPATEPVRDGPCEGSETILVCEDRDDVLRLVCGLLADHGYRVLSALRGPEAVRTAMEFEGRIDLLLTDVVMPGMTGRQLADAIVPRRPNVKVLFITGYPADALRSVNDLAVPHCVVTKPFHATTLLRTLRSLLDS